MTKIVKQTVAGLKNQKRDKIDENASNFTFLKFWLFYDLAW